MGHTSITTTMNTYGHLLPSAFQGVGERLEALVQGTNKAQAVKVGSETRKKRKPKAASELDLRLVETSGFEPPTS